MELIWNELPLEQMIYLGSAQALVEGSIPLPEGRLAEEVLSCTGEIQVTDAAAKDGAVWVEGRVKVDVICRDSGVFAFASSAGFRHTIPAEGVKLGMTAQVFPLLQSLDITGSGSSLSISAVADLACRVTDSKGCRAVFGIRGVSDVEEDIRRLELGKSGLCASGSFRLREEIDAPFAERLLYSQVQCSIKDATDTPEGVRLEGTLYISALTESKSGAMSQLSHAIPFAQVVEGAGASLWAEGEVAAFDLRCNGEFGIITLEVQVSYKLYSSEGISLGLPCDMFSPAMPFVCTKNHLRLCSSLGGVQHRHSVSETVALPQGLPEIQRVIYTALRPIITGQSVEEGKLTVEGLLFTRIIYAAESGSLFSFGEDIPFAFSMDAKGATDAVVTATASGQSSGSGRSIELSCTICASAKLYGMHTVSAICGIEECPPPSVPHGLIACFPAAGETLYSLARRYNTSRDNLRSICPDAQEVLTGRERIVFLN